VSCQKLFDFYIAFFLPEVSKKGVKDFIQNNVSVIVVCCNYFQKGKCSHQVVAAVTFSKPNGDDPIYIAYMGVSDGKKKRPLLNDKELFRLPPNFPFPTIPFQEEDDYTGYQGFGLGSLLLALMC
jgi:hypothetical protein